MNLHSRVLIAICAAFGAMAATADLAAASPHGGRFKRVRSAPGALRKPPPGKPAGSVPLKLGAAKGRTSAASAQAKRPVLRRQPARRVGLMRILPPKVRPHGLQVPVPVRGPLASGTPNQWRQPAGRAPKAPARFLGRPLSKRSIQGRMERYQLKSTLSSPELKPLRQLPRWGVRDLAPLVLPASAKRVSRPRPSSPNLSVAFQGRATRPVVSKSFARELARHFDAVRRPPVPQSQGGTRVIAASKPGPIYDRVPSMRTLTQDLSQVYSKLPPPPRPTFAEAVKNGYGKLPDFAGGAPPVPPALAAPAIPPTAGRPVLRRTQRRQQLDVSTVTYKAPTAQSSSWGNRGGPPPGS